MMQSFWKFISYVKNGNNIIHTYSTKTKQSCILLHGKHLNVSDPSCTYTYFAINRMALIMFTLNVATHKGNKGNGKTTVRLYTWYLFMEFVPSIL